MGYFEDTLADWIETNRLFDGGSRVLLAVSGGADSVAMAHTLHRLRAEGRLKCEFVIGHVNHGLRGADSDGDQAFVRSLADQLKMPVFSRSADVTGYAKTHKLSIETAARTLRLEALAGIADQNACDRIATAHHADDQAETLIHRLMRGTGLRGLCGIKPLSVVGGAVYVRPMLRFRRSEILHYCTANAIHWRHDESNSCLVYTRNRLRLRLLPTLEAESENLVPALSALSTAARDFSAKAERHAGRIVDEAAVETPSSDGVQIPQAALQDCPPWVFYEVIRHIIMTLNVGLRDYTKEHFEAIRALLDKENGILSLPGDIQVYTRQGILGFRCGCPTVTCPLEPVALKAGQTIRFGPWTITAKLLDRRENDFEQFLTTKDAFAEWFDADAIAGDLVVRPRQEGDRFWPIGAASRKKVGRFLIDAGLDGETKRQAFVVADAEKILWLAPVRMAEEGKVSQKTRRILEIRVSL
jgi:tRNA(Ile)-lysidine synthase